MEIIGKIILALPEVSGTSKAGNVWKKREYVLETQDSFPKKVFFDFFNDRADQYPLAVGQVIKLSFDIESREYNGRWYTSIRGWRAEEANEASVVGAPSAQAPYGMQPSAPAPGAVPPPPAVTQPIPAHNDEDLPF